MSHPEQMAEVAAAYLVKKQAEKDDFNQFMAETNGGADAESGAIGDRFRRWRANRNLRQGERQSERAQKNIAKAARLDPTLAAALEDSQNLPSASDMSRSDNRAVAGIPDGYTDPTVLVIIPDQGLAAAGSLSVTTPPPSTYFAAYLLLSVSAAANALFSVSQITIGGVPVLQGAGAFGADMLAPGSFNVPPIRRIIPTSQPITIAVTNNDAALRRVSAYFYGFMTRNSLSNY